MKLPTVQIWLVSLLEEPMDAPRVDVCFRCSLQQRTFIELQAAVKLREDAVSRSVSDDLRRYRLCRTKGGREGLLREADSPNVWECSASTVVNPTISADVRRVCVGHIVGQSRIVIGKVCVDSGLLIRRSLVIIGKATVTREQRSTGQVVLHDALGVQDGLVRFQLRTAYRQDPGAAGERVGVVDGLVLARAAQKPRRCAVAWKGADAVVT